MIRIGLSRDKRELRKFLYIITLMCDKSGVMEEFAFEASFEETNKEEAKAKEMAFNEAKKMAKALEESLDKVNFKIKSLTLRTDQLESMSDVELLNLKDQFDYEKVAAMTAAMGIKIKEGEGGILYSLAKIIAKDPTIDLGVLRKKNPSISIKPEYAEELIDGDGDYILLKDLTHVGGMIKGTKKIKAFIDEVSTKFFSDLKSAASDEERVSILIEQGSYIKKLNGILSSSSKLHSNELSKLSLSFRNLNYTRNDTSIFDVIDHVDRISIHWADEDLEAYHKIAKVIDPHYASLYSIYGSENGINEISPLQILNKKMSEINTYKEEKIKAKSLIKEYVIKAIGDKPFTERRMENAIKAFIEEGEYKHLRVWDLSRNLKEDFSEELANGKKEAASEKEKKESSKIQVSRIKSVDRILEILRSSEIATLSKEEVKVLFDKFIESSTTSYQNSTFLHILANSLKDNISRFTHKDFIYAYEAKKHERYGRELSEAMLLALIAEGKDYTKYKKELEYGITKKTAPLLINLSNSKDVLVESLTWLDLSDSKAESLIEKAIEKLKALDNLDEKDVNELMRVSEQTLAYQRGLFSLFSKISYIDDNTERYRKEFEFKSDFKKDLSALFKLENSYLTDVAWDLFFMGQVPRSLDLMAKAIEKGEKINDIQNIYSKEVDHVDINEIIASRQDIKDRIYTVSLETSLPCLSYGEEWVKLFGDRGDKKKNLKYLKKAYPEYAPDYSLKYNLASPQEILKSMQGMGDYVLETSESRTPAMLKEAVKISPLFIAKSIRYIKANDLEIFSPEECRSIYVSTMRISQSEFKGSMSGETKALYRKVMTLAFGTEDKDLIESVLSDLNTTKVEEILTIKASIPYIKEMIEHILSMVKDEGLKMRLREITAYHKTTGKEGAMELSNILLSGGELSIDQWEKMLKNEKALAHILLRLNEDQIDSVLSLCDEIKVKYKGDDKILGYVINLFNEYNMKDFDRLPLIINRLEITDLGYHGNNIQYLATRSCLDKTVLGLQKLGIMKRRYPQYLNNCHKEYQVADNIEYLMQAKSKESSHEIKMHFIFLLSLIDITAFEAKQFLKEMNLYSHDKNRWEYKLLKAFDLIDEELEKELA